MDNIIELPANGRGRLPKIRAASVTRNWSERTLLESYRQLDDADRESLLGCAQAMATKSGFARPKGGEAGQWAEAVASLLTQLHRLCSLLEGQDGTELHRGIWRELLGTVKRDLAMLGVIADPAAIRV